MEQGWIDIIVKLYEQKLGLKNNMLKGSKRDKVSGYLDVLEEARKRVMETKDEHLEKLYKQFYHDIFVIKEEDIPYSVYEAEQRIARNQGYGTIPITESYIKEKNEQIIKDQKESLNKWIDYFLWDEEAKYYPSWEMFWVIEGLQKLGQYDKEKQQFTKRNKNTIYPYPDIDKAAVFNTINLMEEFLEGKTEIEEIKAALGQGNFKQLYEYSLKHLSAGKQENYGSEGIWVKYDQGSDYHILRDSLQGYNTGWCTAAGEGFARDQLKNGDFYVYYSKDENEEYKIPRIAIRMDGKQRIGEIRGILKDQNLEPEMLPILDKKLEEFPDREKYYKKEQDMAKLTIIEEKTKNNQELTIEEITFLYEINSNIEGFGWHRDPRIEEIKGKRNKRKDIAQIYGCAEDEVALDVLEVLNNKKIKIYFGDLTITGKDLSYVEGKLILPEIVTGNLDLDALSNAEDVVFPKVIKGDLSLLGLRSIENITFPEEVGCDLILEDLRCMKNVVLPKTIGGFLNLNRLTAIENVKFPEEVKESILMSDLEQAKNLVFSKIVGGDLIIEDLKYAENVVFPEKVGANVYLNHLKDSKNLILPKEIGGALAMPSIESAENYTFPEKVGNGLYLTALKTAKGLKLPKEMHGPLNLMRLESLEDLILPEILDGDLMLNSVTSINGFVFPKEIHGGLNLPNTTTLKNVVFPEYISGYLNIELVTAMKNVVFPRKIGTELMARNVSKINNIKIPDGFSCQALDVSDKLYVNYFLENNQNYQVR